MQTPAAHLRDRAPILLALAALLNLAAPAATASWNQYAGDFGNTRYVPGELDASSFTAAWSYSFNYPAGSGWSERGVAVDGQRVYVTMMDGSYSSALYHVQALNLFNGSINWTTTLQAMSSSGAGEPVVLDGNVYVNRGGHSSRVGVFAPGLHRLDAETGTVLGITYYDMQWGTHFRPKPAGGSLIAPGGTYGGTYGFDPAGGQFWWKDDYFNIYVGENDEYRLAASQTHAYIDNHKINPLTGELAANLIHPEDFYLVAPIVSGAALYYSSSAPYTWTDPNTSRRISRFEETTGNWTWDFVLPEQPKNFAVNGNSVLAMLSDRLVGIDSETGQQQFEWISGRNSLGAELAVTDSHAFLIANGRLIAFDLETHVPVWTKFVPPNTRLAVSDGMLFASGYNRVDAYRIAAPDPITLQPTLDAQTQWNGSSFDVTDGHHAMTSQHADFIDLDNRMIMEFDLGQVPGNATILGATLTLDTQFYTFNSDGDYPQLEFYAYAGDGALTVTDATAGTTLIGTGPTINSSDPFDIQLDAAAIQALIEGGATHLGLVGVSGPNGQQLGVTTTEGAPLWGAPPQLSIEYDWLAQHLLGDYDGNGLVGQGDLALVLAHWGAAVQDEELVDLAWYNTVGVTAPLIGQDELALVLANWGNSAAVDVAAVADATGLSEDEVRGLIPEPATAAMLVFGTPLLMRRRAA